MKLQKGLLIVQIDNTIFGSWVKIIIHVLYKGNEKVAKEKIRIHGLIFSVRRPKQISLSCRKRVRPQYKAARGLLGVNDMRHYFANYSGRRVFAFFYPFITWLTTSTLYCRNVTF